MNSHSNRKTVKLESRERASEFKRFYEITTIVGVGGGGTVYAGKILAIDQFFVIKSYRTTQ